MEQLAYLTSQERLDAYNLILEGCKHLWSKNKLQTETAIPVLQDMIRLGNADPLFLAHLTSWAAAQDSKDLKVVTTYANSLSDADGSRFSPTSKFHKPNLRVVSAAAIQQFDPKLVRRVKQLASLKFAVPEINLKEGTHYASALNTAIHKYLAFRENNLGIVRGIKKAGLANTYISLYRAVHRRPTDEVAAILRWQQRDRTINFEETLYNFEGLTDLEIAEKIRTERLSLLGVIGALDKISPVIAVALLEQATGNQAVILRRTFEEQGILQDEEVAKLYRETIAGATTALDRAKTLSEDASAEVKQMLAEARSAQRKEQTKDIGKVYMHLDYSGSMDGVQDIAKERGAIIAECVNNPSENFRWGRFGGRGEGLPLPPEFTEDGFETILYNYRDSLGSTDVFALYPMAREFGADVDVFITDQHHTDGNLTTKIRNYHESHPDVKKPKAVVVIDFGGWNARISKGDVEQAFEANNIPVSVVQPDTLTNSALVVQTIVTAMQGPMATIDAIMATPLLELPDWYGAISSKNPY